MTLYRVAVPPAEERVLVTELAEAVLDQAAPEELVVFDVTAHEFFENPRTVARRQIS